MHPYSAFPANQDAFPSWKSSLRDFSRESGSISPLEIIPLKHFYLTRMHSPDENHPSQTFPANQDQFPRRESSLSDIFIYPGCIPTTKIIPARLFPRIRINSPTGILPKARVIHCGCASCCVSTLLLYLVAQGWSSWPGGGGGIWYHTPSFALEPSAWAVSFPSCFTYLW